MVTIAKAPAKIILLGEHFCVHGAPAISMAINLYAKVKVEDWKKEGLYISSRNFGVSAIYRNKINLTKKTNEESAEKILNPIKIAIGSTLKSKGLTFKGLKVEVDSEIPVGVGLGSSAAIAVATVAAVTKHFGLNLPKKEICFLAYNPERYTHFNPSGVDQATSAYGGIILYKIGLPVKHLKLLKHPAFIVGNTGIKRVTGDFVKKVGKLKEEKGKLLKSLLKKAENLVLDGVKALESGNIDLFGSLMNKNHELLSKIGVSHEKLELFIDVARKAGALGAKLTGGGGGGCMIALAKPEKLVEVSKAIREVGGDIYTVETDWIGVQSWIKA